MKKFKKRTDAYNFSRMYQKLRIINAIKFDRVYTTIYTKLCQTWKFIQKYICRFFLEFYIHFNFNIIMNTDMKIRLYSEFQSL